MSLFHFFNKLSGDFHKYHGSRQKEYQPLLSLLPETVEYPCFAKEFAFRICSPRLAAAECGIQDVWLSERKNFLRWEFAARPGDDQISCGVFWGLGVGRWNKCLQRTVNNIHTEHNRKSRSGIHPGFPFPQMWRTWNCSKKLWKNAADCAIYLVEQRGLPTDNQADRFCSGEVGVLETGKVCLPDEVLHGSGNPVRNAFSLRKIL